MSPRRVAAAAWWMVLASACFGPSPTVFRCDPLTGRDCDSNGMDAGSSEPSVVGSYSMILQVDQPEGTAGRVLFTPFQLVRATLSGVKVSSTATQYLVDIPGLLGPCCSPTPAMSTDLVMPPQTFDVVAGTPMRLAIAEQPDQSYQTTATWSVELVDSFKGVRLSDGTIRFARGRGRTFDTPDRNDPLNYFVSFDLKPSR